METNFSIAGPSNIPQPAADTFDPTPLSSDEYHYLLAARRYGSDHRDAHGYAAVGSLADASADIRGAFRALTSQVGGAR